MNAVSEQRAGIQRAIDVAAYFLLGITALGSLLDAASNAISIVTPVVTYGGIALIAVSWVTAYILLRFRAVRWKPPGSAVVYPISLGPRTTWAMVGMVCLLLVPRFVDRGDDAEHLERLSPPLSPHVTHPERETVIIFLPEGQLPASEHESRNRKSLPIIGEATSQGVDTSRTTSTAVSHPGSRLRFLVRTIDGKVFSPMSLANKVVVINLWATWCRPCVDDLPRLAEFAHTQSSDVVVICVADGEDEAHVRAFATAHPFDVPFIADPEHVVSRLFERAELLPRTYVLGRNGEVVFERFGTISFNELERATATALVRPAA
jgi:thiol-disulfide isomerase/thioredoxin